MFGWSKKDWGGVVDENMVGLKTDESADGWSIGMDENMFGWKVDDESMVGSKMDESSDEKVCRCPCSAARRMKCSTINRGKRSFFSAKSERNVANLLQSGLKSGWQAERGRCQHQPSPPVSSFPLKLLQNPLILYSTYKLETASKKSAKICVLLIQIRPQSDKIWMKVCGEFWTNCESDIVTFWTKQQYHLINAMNIYNLANIEWS